MRPQANERRSAIGAPASGRLQLISCWSSICDAAGQPCESGCPAGDMRFASSFG